MSILDYLEETKAEWQGFFYAVRHSEIEFVKQKLFHHLSDESQYLISKEIAKNSHKETDGQHVHVVAQMTLAQYHKLNKNMKDKYGLNGSPSKGTKQYGKIANIKDIKKLLAYCMKDGDYETNIQPEVIEELKLLSYPKEEGNEKVKVEKKCWTTEVIRSLELQYPDKVWKPSHKVDFKIITDRMFDMLGKHGKSFDATMFNKMYTGIVNRLHTTLREEEDFRDKVRGLAKVNYVSYEY